ncbi:MULTISPECIES: hypothetical protein [Pseudomonas syringae group]|uniref:hypothetical protein n=1 Tax=Pseudomonas syringae group TaxID=136849 RepID=UPI0009B394C2|nr:MULTISPECIES: hypothetical protein [Pseudomonas syringae group]POQ09461.1 hypothetical protein CXB40_04745 [Pseudomonas syringae pv. avii]
MPVTAIRIQQRTQNRAKPGGYESRARIRHALRDREGREEIPDWMMVGLSKPHLTGDRWGLLVIGEHGLAHMNGRKRALNAVRAGFMSS